MSLSKQTRRRNARVKALQAVYQWDLNLTAGNHPDSEVIEKQFLQTQEMDRSDLEYFSELLNAIPRLSEELDLSLQAGLDRPIEEIDPIERCICRIAAYELAHRLDTPMKVVINEWVEITKKFGADQGHKFVNAVLDKTAASLRPIEQKALTDQQGPDAKSVTVRDGQD